MLSVRIYIFWFFVACCNCLCSIALFELEEYESSKQSFERSVELSQQQGKKDISAQNRWIRKCESEIEGQWKK